MARVTKTYTQTCSIDIEILSHWTEEEIIDEAEKHIYVLEDEVENDDHKVEYLEDTPDPIPNEDDE